MSDRLSEIEARVNAATAGPWLLFAKGRVVELQFGAGRTLIKWTGFDGSDTPILQQRANARFIKHAREDIPYLLDLCRILMAQVDTLCNNECACGRSLAPDGRPASRLKAAMERLRQRIIDDVLDCCPLFVDGSGPACDSCAEWVEILEAIESSGNPGELEVTR